jgi:serine/threonine protein kinase
VALKELFLTSAAMRRRFMREILIMARLQHPSIVPVYDAGSLGDRSPFYAMKLVVGQPLRDDRHRLGPRQGSRRGHAAYMAPEQAIGESVDERADVAGVQLVREIASVADQVGEVVGDAARHEQVQ